MKKIAYLMMVLFGSQAAFADLEKNQVAYDMMLFMMKSAPDDGLAETASCLGVSEATVNNIVDRAMQKCFDQHKNEPHNVFTRNMDVCITPAIDKESGFSQAELDKCDPQEDKAQRELVELDIQIEMLSQQLDQLYSSGASDSEIEALQDQLRDLENQYMDWGDALYDDMAANMKSTDDVARIMQAASQAFEKSLHLVTLPIYEHSQVVIHMLDGQQTGIDGALPVATFFSKDESKKILAYYRKKLPRFKYRNLGGGEHLLMESIPDNFDLAADMQTFMSTPHIFIRVLEGESTIGIPAATKSSIQVVYRERN